MKKTTMRFAFAVTLISIIAIGAVVVASAQEQSLMSDRSIEGTWRTSVTPVNCQTGTPVAPPFPGILAFAQGGTLSGTSATVTSVYGVWDKAHGRRSYSFAFTNLRYDPSGAVIGSQTVRQTASMSGRDEFTSSGTVQFLDLAGNPVGSGCAISTGTRFE